MTTNSVQARTKTNDQRIEADLTRLIDDFDPLISRSIGSVVEQLEFSGVVMDDGSVFLACKISYDGHPYEFHGAGKNFNEALAGANTRLITYLLKQKGAYLIDGQIFLPSTIEIGYGHGV